MTHKFRAVALALLAVAVLPFMARADDQDTIDYRQRIMKSLGEQSAAMDQILQHKVAPDNFQIHAQTLAVISKMAKTAFEPKVAGGQARPEVWANWADFSKRLDELTAYADTAARAAKDGGVAAAGPILAASHICKDCHDTYRQEKK